jgi:hypothetical protein
MNDLGALLLCCNILFGKRLMKDKDQLLRQVERLASSQVLHGSESLCKLLRYLAHNAVEHPGVPVKEYQIATELFGRPADFDPQSDSAVRVQAGRLRTKIGEYYASEGSEDPVLIELPKGSYALSFHHRTNGHSRAVVEAAATNTIPLEVHSRVDKKTLGWVLLTAIVSAAIVLVAQSSFRPSADISASVPKAAPQPLRDFWQPFLTGSDEPWVVFSNAAFVGRPETGIRYYVPGKDARDRIWDHYTGVGEVLAIHSLDQTFEKLGRRIRVKRGSLLSLDDASNTDLIFVGSPSENLTLMDLPSTKEFIFRRVVTGPRKGDLAIVNVNPNGNEPHEVLASPSQEPLIEDYAIIGMMPGVNPAHSVIILAGTTTFGTQAAVEFLGRPESVGQLLKQLGTKKNDRLPPFEALLHVKVTRGVPLEADLVAVRRR